jgi:hypothetical protein
MTESMIERVARAIYEVSAEPEHGDSWEAVSSLPWGDNLREHARAAIEAMREPTEAMKYAYNSADLYDIAYSSEAWSRAIDAALTPDSKE